VRRATYRSPAIRAHVYRTDLPKVVTVHENRFVASGLLEALEGRAEVVADCFYGVAALRLADLLTPSVVVAGELLGDGLIDHFLPDLVRAGARVLLVAEELHPDRLIELVGRGLSGVCTTDNGLASVADAVVDVAEGGVALPAVLMAAVVTQWRSGSRRSSTGPDLQLTLREMEVLNAMVDGLSTKATARLLGVAIKTVENHKTRVFAKLGVRNQAQLISERTAERGYSPTIDENGLRTR
jgi:DNA-binding NarL/FixJ family response regulator